MLCSTNCGRGSGCPLQKGRASRGGTLHTLWSTPDYQVLSTYDWHSCKALAEAQTAEMCDRQTTCPDVLRHTLQIIDEQELVWGLERSCDIFASRYHFNCSLVWGGGGAAYAYLNRTGKVSDYAHVHLRDFFREEVDQLCLLQSSTHTHTYIHPHVNTSGAKPGVA